MFDKLKLDYRLLKRGPPGVRFLNIYHHQHAPGSGLRTVVAVVISVILMVGGLLLGLVPGVPGIVLGLIGVALLAAQFRVLAKCLDRLELRLRRLLKKRQRLASPRQSARKHASTSPMGNGSCLSMKPSKRTRGLMAKRHRRSTAKYSPRPLIFPRPSAKLLPPRGDLNFVGRDECRFAWTCEAHFAKGQYCLYLQCQKF